MIGRTRRAHRFDYYPSINISNTNHLIIDKAQGVIKSLGIPCTVIYKLKKHIKNKSYWSLDIRGIKRVKHALDILLPYIECRRPQAKTLYKYVSSRLEKPGKAPIDSQEFEWLNQLKELNGSQRFESPETICQAQLKADEDIVRPSLRGEELDRNVQAASLG